MLLLTAFSSLVQIIGYGTRIFAHYHTNQIATYVVQSCFILLAPVFYAASIYMVLGRLIRSVHGERLSVIRPTRMTKLFVAGDIFSLTVQGNAAGLTAKDSTQKIGEYIITAGLLIQLIIFGFFVIAAVIFHKRMRQEIAKGSELSQDIPWRQGLKMLYACSALIMLRSIFRVIEYVMGIDGYLLSNEWPMYVFDAALMWSVQVIFFIWFPDKFQFSSVNVEEDGHMLVENESPIRWRRYFDKTLRTM
ncbi:hypothetical protein H2198_005573 [Neophaeococcomyces mojaviensis]|uniref:Uncharacterized protein n=1 Tax=Neophaeococcomyces mojaviensis TaxID=3383035 RepID=A0ACC3A5R8_9EURO|nr:hypothetical protein H2198_005573 [Knufia sp. JES_112]